MEEDQGRASPPLSSKGSYNIDFDALDDGFNPFQTSASLRNSPPPQGEKPVSNTESWTENAAGGGDHLHVSSDAPKEPSETPKKKKSKSHSKRASAVAESEGNEAAADMSASGEGFPDASAVAADVPDKPVKTRKVKKPKSRPVSKNLEQKSDGLGTPEKVQVSDESASTTAIGAAEDGDSKDSAPTSTSASTPQDHSVQEQQENSWPQSEEIPSAVDKNISQPDGSSPQLEQDRSQPELPGEKSHQEEAAAQEALAPPEDAVPAEKSSRHKEKSASPAGEEEGVEGSSSRKERSAGKVKKSKTKVKKSSRHSVVEGDVDGMDNPSERDRERRGSPRVDSQGDAGVAPESPVDGGPVKAKHPATRVLEQQVRDDQSQALGKNILPNDSEDDFYDAFDSPPSMTMDQMQSYTDMSDSCTLFQSHDGLGGLSWSQEDGTLLDEGAGEAAFAEDLTIGDSDMADGHSTESVVKLVQVLKYSQSDWNKLRQELELTFQAQLLAKEKEWSGKLADRDARLATMEEANKKLRQTNEDMRTVMGEFEKTIGQLQSEKEKTSNASQQSLQDVVKERDQALEDLQSVETAFSDLHRRYEKTKGVVDGFKQNEEVLKKCVQDLQTKLKKAEQKVQVLKEQAEEKLERASEEIEKTKKSSASEIARLEAALRKTDLQIQGMESTLEQKVKENKELAAICDELIAKVQ